MTQIISTQASHYQGNRLGFKRKGSKGLLEDFKVHCAKLGRMDLYHIVAAHRRKFFTLTRLVNIGQDVVWGNLPLEKLENFVNRIGNSDPPSVWRGHRDNTRYTQRAMQKASVALRSSHASKADRELAVPALFPED